MSDVLKKWIGSIIILPIAVYLTFNKGEFLFIDYLNLLIHEGGHGIFSFFGKFIYTLGGTLMQIIIPSLFIFYFATNDKMIGTQLSIVWLGESLMNISVYAADARLQALPLLGGNNVYHDWNYLLGELNILNYDSVVGDIFYFGGIIAYLIAILIPLFFNRYEKIDLKLDTK